jgi:hypothetical protein
MPTAVIAAQVTGTLDTADRRAMLYIVEQENAQRAALVPPDAPLPHSTNTEIRTSYAIVQSALLNKAHLSYVDQSDIATLQDIRTLWPNATDQQRAAAKAALQ